MAAGVRRLEEFFGVDVAGILPASILLRDAYGRDFLAPKFFWLWNPLNLGPSRLRGSVDTGILLTLGAKKIYDSHTCYDPAITGEHPEESPLTSCFAPSGE